MTDTREGVARRAVLAGAAAAPALGAAKAPRRIDAVSDFIRERMAAKGVPGASLTVVQAGRVTTQGFGKLNVELGLDASGTSVFTMASASKMMSGLSAGLLAEAGKLDLDGPVTDYLPELPKPFTGVSLARMLSHTSGLGTLRDVPTFGEERAKREAANTLAEPNRLDYFTDDEILTYAAQVPLRDPPGSSWRYNQLPIFLFGQVVRRLTGKAFHEFVAERIFRPLGMSSAVYGDHRVLVPGRPSTIYTRQFGPLQNIALRYSPAYWGAAGLNASAADLGKLLTGFEPGRLLKPATLDRLWTPVVTSDGKPSNYGLAFALAGQGRDRSAGHEGGGCCYVRWWPEARLGVAILLNLSSSQEDNIERRAGSLLLGREV